ncbi:50S ribosomal protein L44e [Candidatus Woesearchaeota archaeon]|nr:50S ribosomal protein L44e [Candidatus Woesearchaeota archaeon]
MKLPTTMRTYCPYCKKYTKHKVIQVKKKGKGSRHPLSKGGKPRTKRRGLWRGHGNLGRYSKPPKPKMTGKKQSKVVDLRLQCKVCNKQHVKVLPRAKRVEIKS